MTTERILQYLDYKGINKRQFYLKTGLSNGFLDKVKDIGSSKIEIIIYCYPDINPMWLLTGKGKMILQEIAETTHGNKIYIESDIVADVDDRMNYGKDDISALKLKIMQLESKVEMLSEFNEKLLDRLGDKSSG
jgi:hypothetical protein